MGLRRTSLRMVDVAVATVCVACIGVPLIPIVSAAQSSGSVVESGGTVDQRVLEAGMISNPIRGSFEAGGSGVRDGSISWDLYSTASGGMKLLASSDRTPAMRDSQNGVDIADQSASVGPWSVSGSDRKFGFTAVGDMTLRGFNEGRHWRGFEGQRGVEIARKGSPIGRVRTTVRLRAEFGSSLASNARPSANILVTAVPNY